MNNPHHSSVYFGPPRFPPPTIPGGEPDADWPAEDLRHLHEAERYPETLDVEAMHKAWQQISPFRRWLPRARLIELELAQRSKQYEISLEIAESLIPIVPHDARPRAYASYALEQLGRLPEAIVHLLSLDRAGCTFWPIHHNLADYTCRLGRIEEARQWLRRSLKFEPELTRVYGLFNEDIKPLWDELNPTNFDLASED